MSPIIDLRSEILVDRTRVRDPYLRLLLAALGQEVVKGSAWVAVDNRVARRFEPLNFVINGQRPGAAA